MENDMRKLNPSALENACQILNQDFIDSLPYSPEELFEFAKRRTNPTISDNISYNLGKRMLESRLTDEDYFITFLKVIGCVFEGKTPASSSPRSTGTYFSNRSRQNKFKKEHHGKK